MAVAVAVRRRTGSKLLAGRSSVGRRSTIASVGGYDSANARRRGRRLAGRGSCEERSVDDVEPDGERDGGGAQPTKAPWFRRRFGSHLRRYDRRSRTAVAEPTAEALERVRGDGVVAVFLVPLPEAGVRYANQDCGRQLLRLYERLATGESRPSTENRRPGFEVVQVCFPHRPPNLGRRNHDLDSALDPKAVAEYASRLASTPWFALPLDDIERSIRLRHHYGVRDGEFALVLLHGDTGKAITTRGYDRLLGDERGYEFPWIPSNALGILRQIPRYVSGRRRDDRGFVESNGTCSFEDVAKDSILGLYFSAHWCPPCKAFTSQLIGTYAAVKECGRKFEIIFVSSDRSAESYGHYVSTMPWLAIPYEDEASRAHLTSLYGIRSIPSLILLDSDGSVITEDGRGEIADDPKATNFPWFSKAVSLLTARMAAKLHKYPAVVLFMDAEEDGAIELATAVLAPISRKVIEENADEPLLFVVAPDSDTSESVREYLRLDDVSPLLTLVDISLRRYAVMEYGKEINERTIVNFVRRFYDNELIFSSIDRHS